ncbi:CPBP family intramembrane glutamic endopeptidase [uncultured Croceitalea sp.]|uniref:CPBP family intramembrane glutamic endopeptidase n=1 Tax=uncultured Croceitalea sp. TaxID=1798908 RepID=UPI00374FBBCA
MLKEVWEFFKNPLYHQEEYDTKTKTKFFLRLAFITVGFSLILGFLIEGITSLVGFSFENHAVIEMFEDYSVLMIFFFAVLLAPVLEELIFRAPLGLFKNSKHFKYAFYISVLFFGLIHIGNYESVEGYYWLVPVLVAPQISAGIFLGFIRTKLGLVWSILLHAAHNLVLIGPFIILKLLDIPFE